MIKLKKQQGKVPLDMKSPEHFYVVFWVVCILTRPSCSRNPNVEHVGKGNVVRNIPKGFNLL